jgi:hypothetical protein
MLNNIQARPAVITPRRQATFPLLFILITCHVLLVALWAWQLNYVLYRPAHDPRLVILVAVATTVVSSMIFLLRRDLSLLGFVGIYFLYTALANLGAVAVTLVVEYPFDELSLSSVVWFYSDLMPYAVALSGLALGSYTFSTSVLTRVIKPRDQRKSTLHEKGDRGLLILGLLLLIGATAILLGAVWLGALPLFGTYTAFIEARRSFSGYSYLLFALATGFVSGHRRPP